MTFLSTTGSAEKLIDYTDANYIPILDGDMVLWKHYGYLTHFTNISLYQAMNNEARNLIDLFPQSHMRKLLDSDITHIDTLLRAVDVHHRQARSLNFLGTALKVIAGTPDFDDHQRLQIRQDMLVDSNNKQFTINTHIQQKILEITDKINKIIATTRREEIDTGHLYENILARNRIITFELQAVTISLTLAKLNLVSPALLDSSEINKIINEHSTNITTMEILGISRVKVLQNKDNLYFIIKYPIPELVCKKVSLFAVSHQGRTLHFGETNTVALCGNKTHAVRCEKSTSAAFCKALETITCGQQLVAGEVANCSTIANHDKGIKEIDDGIVVINNVTAKIEGENGVNRAINGTFLLTFDQAVKINGIEYRNRNNAANRSPGTPTAQRINILGHIETLSLNYLQEMNVDNINHIGALRREVYSKSMAFAIIVTSVIILTVLWLTIGKYKKHAEKRAMNVLVREVTGRIADDPHLGREELTRHPSTQPALSA